MVGFVVRSKLAVGYFPSLQKPRQTGLSVAQDFERRALALDVISSFRSHVCSFMSVAASYRSVVPEFGSERYDVVPTAAASEAEVRAAVIVISMRWYLRFCRIFRRFGRTRPAPRRRAPSSREPRPRAALPFPPCLFVGEARFTIPAPFQLPPAVRCANRRRGQTQPFGTDSNDGHGAGVGPPFDPSHWRRNATGTRQCPIALSAAPAFPLLRARRRGERHCGGGPTARQPRPCLGVAVRGGVPAAPPIGRRFSGRAMFRSSITTADGLRRIRAHSRSFLRLHTRAGLPLRS